MLACQDLNEKVTKEKTDKLSEAWTRERQKLQAISC